MFRTGTQFMILLLLAGLALNMQSRLEPLASWDNAFADFLAMNSRRHSANPAPVVLVEIDDGNLANKPWPWTPLDFTLFFRAALPQQPDVLAIDEVLDWNRFALPEDHQRMLPQYETVLRDYILRSPRVLLGAKLGYPPDPEVIPPLQQTPLIRNVKGSIREIPEFTAVETEPSENFRLSSAIGFTNLPANHQRFNSAPLVFNYRGQITPSFTLQAVMLWAKLTPDDITVLTGSHIALGDKIRIPIDAAGRMRVDFGSPRPAPFSLQDLNLAYETSQAGRKPNIPLKELKNSVVLLSRTDQASKTLSFASGRNGSPGQLFAAAIATIQNQSFIRPCPLWANGVVLAAFTILSAFVPQRKKMGTIVLGIIALTVYGMIAMAVFNQWLLYLPFVLPVGMVIVFCLIRLSTPNPNKRLKKPVIF
jgi:CHASE2 domain-containing sensor protein